MSVFSKKKNKIDLSRKKTDKRYSKLTSMVRETVKNCGTELQVFGEVELYSPENITIGDHCKLNSRVLLNGRSGITIGNDVTVSPGAMILSTGYDMDRFWKNGDRVHREDTPVFIGDHCWICAGAIILPGVMITGEYVVVAAGAVVTKDITESRVVVAGNPAKIVKRIGDPNAN